MTTTRKTLNVITTMACAIASAFLVACGGGSEDGDTPHEAQQMATAPSIATYPYRMTLRTWATGQRGYSTQYLYYRTSAACSKAAAQYTASVRGRIVGYAPSTILRIEATCSKR